MTEQFPAVQGNPDFVACINERHFDRVKGYIDEASKKGARVIPLCPPGEEFSERKDHKIALHLIVSPEDDLTCMQDEIFGAILNINDLGEGLPLDNAEWPWPAVEDG